jgi:hypothetical protein
MLQTYRDLIRRRSPPWLQRGIAEKILYALGVHVDAFADAVTAGVKHRFPGYYSHDALPVIGRERRIPRGRVEPDATYASRLVRWLTDHRLRGGPYAMLAQLHAYYAPANFAIDLVYYSGRRFHLATDGTVTRDDVAWTPDTNAARWARWWLFFYTDDFAAPTDDEIEQLRVVPRAWNAAHANGLIVLFPSTAELWNWPPGHTWNETGIWNTGGVSGTIAVED